MIYVDIDTKGTMRLPFYLAMEEYVARNIYKGEDCFFMWQVNPTVIFGRNQVIEDEVNIEYCKSHNIQFYRRKSGGGCVYADMGNVMLSYITGEESVDNCFAYYMEMLTRSFNAIGIPAERNDHNDIRAKDFGQCHPAHDRPRHRSRHAPLRHQHGEHDQRHHTQ